MTMRIRLHRTLLLSVDGVGEGSTGLILNRPRSNAMATMEGIHRLSDELGAKYDDSGVAIILYDIRNYSPIRKMTLTTDEMQELYSMWCDGCCPVCLTEIPLHDVVCDNCHRDAAMVR